MDLKEVKLERVLQTVRRLKFCDVEEVVKDTEFSRHEVGNLLGILIYKEEIVMNVCSVTGNKSFLINDRKAA